MKPTSKLRPFSLLIQKELIQLLLLSTILLIFIFPGFFTGKQYLYPDVYLRYPAWREEFYEPVSQKQYSDLKTDFVDGFHLYQDFYDGIDEGEFRDWSPYRSLGRPLGDLLLSGHLFPITFLLNLLLTPIKSFGFLVIIKLYLGILGTHLLLRELGGSKWEGFFGGLIYPFTGFSVVWMLGYATTIAMIYPWMLFTALKLIKNNKFLDPWIGLSAVVVASSILTGFVAGAGYGIYLTGGFVLFYLLVRVKRKFIKEDLITRTLLFSKYLGSVLLGVAMTAIFFVPTLEYLNIIDVSYRSDAAAVQKLPIGHIMQLFNPFYFGDGVISGFRAAGNYNETSMYVGSMILILAALGVFTLFLDLRTRNKKWWSKLFFLLVAIISLMIVFDIFGILHIVTHFPILNSSSNTRLVSIFCFSIVMFSSLSISSVLEWIKRLYYLVPRFICVVPLIFILPIVVVSLLYNSETVEMLDLNRARFLFIGMIPLVTTISVSAGVVTSALLYSAERIRKDMFIVIVTLLALSELVLLASRQTPLIDEELFYPDTPLTEFLDSNTKSYERVIGTDNIFVYSSTERMYGLNSPISHDLHQQLEIGIINLIGEDIWDSQTNPQIKANKANFLSPVIDLFGIKYLVVPSSLDIESVSEELDNSYDLVYEWNDVKVYQNLTYEGIAFVIGSIRHYHTDDELLELLSDPELDVYDIAFSNDTELSQKYDQVEPLSSTEIVKYDFDEVVYKVTSSSPGVLVMSELYWPGWKAFINGEEGEIIKINGIFRAVEVPEGVSEVVLMYEGGGDTVGVPISFVSIAIVGLFLMARALLQKVKKA